MNLPGWFSRSSLRILMYHKVDPFIKDNLTVTADQLESQLDWMKARYTFVSLSQIIHCQKNRKQLPANAVLITFDDGFMNNYELAFPIFKKMKIPFAVFLVSSFVDKKLPFDGKNQVFLGKNELSEMAGLVEFGLHSTQHQSLSALESENWQDEVSGCRKELQNLGIPLQPVWAYTYGNYPKRDRQKLSHLKHVFQHTGIEMAFRIGNRINPFPARDVYQMERLDIRGSDSFKQFKRKVKWGKII